MLAKNRIKSKIKKKNINNYSLKKKNYKKNKKTRKYIRFFVTDEIKIQKQKENNKKIKNMVSEMETKDIKVYLKKKKIISSYSKAPRNILINLYINTLENNIDITRL
jgi:hypothetical protein